MSRFCECGCGTRLVGGRADRRYVDTAHRTNASRARRTGEPQRGRIERFWQALGRVRRGGRLHRALTATRRARRGERAGVLFAEPDQREARAQALRGD